MRPVRVALGLAAAGGLALAPATEAEGKRGGAKGRRRGDGPGAQLDLPDLPDPVVSGTLEIGLLSPADTYPVTVTGTITFGAELSALMALGREFRMFCHLEADDPNPVVDVLVPVRPGHTTFGRYFSGGSTAPRPFSFSDNVFRGRLNEDLGGDGDEIVARLYWSTKAPGSGTWRGLRRSNGLLYWQTNLVRRHL